MSKKTRLSAQSFVTVKYLSPLLIDESCPCIAPISLVPILQYIAFNIMSNIATLWTLVDCGYIEYEMRFHKVGSYLTNKSMYTILQLYSQAYSPLVHCRLCCLPCNQHSLSSESGTLAKCLFKCNEPALK